MTRRPPKVVGFSGRPAPPSGSTVMPPPSNPMAVARTVVEKLYTLAHGLILRSHRGDFYYWEGTRWVERERRDIRARLYAALEHATCWHPKEGWVPFAPTTHKVSDVIESLQAITHVESRTDPPLWIDQRTTPPAPELVALTNGVLHVPTRILHPHSPQFFNVHALPFAFDPKATAAPRWMRFLHELWPDDEDAILSLQEVIGYLLAGDNRQQKAFMIIGPKRGGKGTIGRVVTGLIGPHHVAGPTLASLATNFGLSPLIGKSLALISDARLSTRADSKVVVERLLSISGEDSLTVDRKYREPWTGHLPTRFLVLSNELPKLSDASGTIVSRFVLFTLQQSFYGSENPNLTDELLVEAPAIFNWSLEGFDRLVARGHFVQPASGAQAIRAMEDLASTINAFIRQRCLVRRDVSIGVDALWSAWKAWCTESNNAPGTKATFGRDLRTIVPTLKVARPRDKHDRVQRYDGIALRADDTLSSCPDHPDQTRDSSAVSSSAVPRGQGGQGNSGLYPPQDFVFDGDAFGKKSH